MYYIILLLLAIFPSVVILSIVYKKDKEKEPSKLLVSLFGVGILSCFLTVLISNITQVIFPIFKTDVIEQKEVSYLFLAIYSLFQVGLIEELSKWIFNYSICWNNKEFDHIYDSIVYSVFVSLGFATFENILYVLEGGIGTGILRAILSVPGHAFFAINMGYYIGMSKIASINNRKELSIKYKIYSLLVPTILHGFFDFCLLSGNILLILIFLTVIVFLYINSIKKIKQFSKINLKLFNNVKYCPICKKETAGNYCPFCGQKL